MTFKLTYATMSNPPQELHDQYDLALKATLANLGKEYPMFINGQERFSQEKHKAYSPINTSLHLASFQKGTVQDAQDAVAAAKAAFPAWRATPWQERVALMRKFADIVDRRIFEYGVAVSLEVGKNRMEALGDVAEMSDLVRWPCLMMEKNNGYKIALENDPIDGFISTNESVLKPYGVWLVISPFNFPASLAGGPVGNALIAGNTVVIKPATDTTWSAIFLMDCLREAGIPAGVANLVTGPGSTVGNALANHPDIAGVTFTGSKEVGMDIYAKFASGIYPRPAILEMGGKNACIVSKNADIEDAALGCVRASFGLQGQKCSANSRIYVEQPVYQAFVKRMVELTQALSIGDPTLKQNWFGPVINRKSYEDYEKFVAECSQAGRILTGGKHLTEGELAKGYFCAPTIVVDLPLEHRLWKQEMFLPITLVTPVESLEQAMQLTNDSEYGLTGGFYGTDEEAEWYFERVEAGVVYSNRPQSSTTGAWPGFQPFGGWKGSGSTGKNGGGYYYLPFYMHEQSRTRVKRA